jgi:hypothetical protein
MVLSENGLCASVGSSVDLLESAYVNNCWCDLRMRDL